MAINPQTYAADVERDAPRSPLGKNLLLAFLIGGAICTLGEAIHAGYSALDMDIDAAAAATSATLIFIGALLTGLDLYDTIARVGGAGTLVPITGFSNAITSAALEFKSEGYVMGMSAKMFLVAGPVLVFGLSASILYGIILCLIGA